MGLVSSRKNSAELPAAAATFRRLELGRRGDATVMAGAGTERIISGGKKGVPRRGRDISPMRDLISNIYFIYFTCNK